MNSFFSSGALALEILDSHEALSRRAAGLICSALRRRPDLLLCASAGATPSRTYELLAQRAARQPQLFRRLRVVAIDEWYGVPRGSPASCLEDLRVKLFDPLRLGRDRFAGFRCDAKSPEAECHRLRAWLEVHGPIDLCLLGLGTNGHVAMNEPAPEFTPHAHVAKLAPSSVKHPMLQHLARKPRLGLTLGMAEIMCSREILLLASGAHKKRPLQEMLKPRVSTQFPASFLWLHPAARVLCGRAAAPRWGPSAVFQKVPLPKRPPFVSG